MYEYHPEHNTEKYQYSNHNVPPRVIKVLGNGSPCVLNSMNSTARNQIGGLQKTR